MSLPTPSKPHRRPPPLTARPSSTPPLRSSIPRLARTASSSSTTTTGTGLGVGLGISGTFPRAVPPGLNSPSLRRRISGGLFATSGQRSVSGTATKKKRRKKRRKPGEDGSSNSSSESSSSSSSSASDTGDELVRRSIFMAETPGVMFTPKKFLTDTFALFDPQDSGAIGIHDFIPLCRKLEEGFPDAGVYSILKKSAESTVMDIEKSSPGLFLTIVEFEEVFRELTTGTEILDLLQKIQSAHNSNESIDPLSPRPIAPQSPSILDGDSLYHALSDSTTRGPHTPGNKTSVLTASGGTSMAFDSPLGTPVSASTPMRPRHLQTPPIPSQPLFPRSSPNPSPRTPRFSGHSLTPQIRGPPSPSARPAHLRSPASASFDSRPVDAYGDPIPSPTSSTSSHNSASYDLPLATSGILSTSSPHHHHHHHHRSDTPSPEPSYHPSALSLETPLTTLRALTPPEVLTLIQDFRAAHTLAVHRGRSLGEAAQTIAALNEELTSLAAYEEARFQSLTQDYTNLAATHTAQHERLTKLLSDEGRNGAQLIIMEEEIAALEARVVGASKARDAERRMREEAERLVGVESGRADDAERRAGEAARRVELLSSQAVRAKARLEEVHRQAEEQHVKIQLLSGELEGARSKVEEVQEELNVSREDVEAIVVAATPRKDKRKSFGTPLKSQLVTTPEKTTPEGPAPAGMTLGDELMNEDYSDFLDEDDDSGRSKESEVSNASSFDACVQTEPLTMEDVKEITKDYPYELLVIDMVEDYPVKLLVKEFAVKFPELFTPATERRDSEYHTRENSPEKFVEWLKREQLHKQKELVGLRARENPSLEEWLEVATPTSQTFNSRENSPEEEEEDEAERPRTPSVPPPPPPPASSKTSEAVTSEAESAQKHQPTPVEQPPQRQQSIAIGVQTDPPLTLASGLLRGGWSDEEEPGHGWGDTEPFPEAPPEGVPAGRHIIGTLIEPLLPIPLEVEPSTLTPEEMGAAAADRVNEWHKPRHRAAGAAQKQPTVESASEEGSTAAQPASPTPTLPESPIQDPDAEATSVDEDEDDEYDQEQAQFERHRLQQDHRLLQELQAEADADIAQNLREEEEERPRRRPSKPQIFEEPYIRGGTPPPPPEIPPSSTPPPAHAKEGSGNAEGSRAVPPRPKHSRPLPPLGDKRLRAAPRPEYQTPLPLPGDQPIAGVKLTPEHQPPLPTPGDKKKEETPPPTFGKGLAFSTGDKPKETERRLGASSYGFTPYKPILSEEKAEGKPKGPPGGPRGSEPKKPVEKPNKGKGKEQARGPEEKPDKGKWKGKVEEPPKAQEPKIRSGGKDGGGPDGSESDSEKGGKRGGKRGSDNKQDDLAWVRNFEHEINLSDYEYDDYEPDEPTEVEISDPSSGGEGPVKKSADKSSRGGNSTRDTPGEKKKPEKTKKEREEVRGEEGAGRERQPEGSTSRSRGRSGGGGGGGGPPDDPDDPRRNGGGRGNGGGGGGRRGRGRGRGERDPENAETYAERINRNMQSTRPRPVIPSDAGLNTNRHEWPHPYDFGMGIPRDRLPAVPGQLRDPLTQPPTDRGLREPMEDFMQYYWGNYMTVGQRVPPGLGGLNYEAYRAHYWPSYIDTPAPLPDDAVAPAALTDASRRAGPLDAGNLPGEGAYLGNFRIPAPDGEYVERISTTLENRVRLQELSNKPRLTIAEATEITQFVESQYNPPDRVILKTIFILAGKIEKANRRAIRVAEWPDRGDLESLVPYHNPMGIFAWPPRFLWHILASLDWADYQALASRDNITTVMRANGRIGLRDFPPQPREGFLPDEDVDVHETQHIPTPEGPPPVIEGMPARTAAQTIPVTPARGVARNTTRARPTAQSAHRNNDPMNTVRAERGEDVRRWPVGPTADILRAGPRPGPAWGILTNICFLALYILIIHNVYTYSRLKITQRGFEDKMNLYLGPGPFWVDTCYTQCMTLGEPSSDWFWVTQLQKWLNAWFEDPNNETFIPS